MQPVEHEYQRWEPGLTLARSADVSLDTLLRMAFESGWKAQSGWLKQAEPKEPLGTLVIRELESDGGLLAPDAISSIYRACRTTEEPYRAAIQTLEEMRRVFKCYLDELDKDVPDIATLKNLAGDLNIELNGIYPR